MSRDNTGCWNPPGWCVKELVPWELRGDNQTILEESLARKLEVSILERMKDIRVEDWNEKTLLNYEHSWPAVLEYLEMEFELAEKILSRTEVESVTRKLRERRREELTTLGHTVQELGSAECVPKVISELGGTSSSVVIEESSFSTEISGQTYERPPTLMARMDRVDHRLDRNEEKLDDIMSTLRQMQTNLEGIIVFEHEFQDLLRSFDSKVDTMIGYAESSEGSTTPKRRYLSVENVSIVEKVLVAIRLGTAVRLHFMCESSATSHVVKDQPSFLISLEKEQLRWITCILNFSWNMIYYIVKAGLHVTVGLGQTVPDLGDMQVRPYVLVAQAAVENLVIDNIMSSEHVDMNKNMPFTEAWRRLRTLLAPHLRNNYSRLVSSTFSEVLETGGGRVCMVMQIVHEKRKGGGIF